MMAKILNAPTCPAHVGIRMTLVGDIAKTTWAGKRTVLGYRYRCPVSRCPAVETIMLDETGAETESARSQK